jgi:hypothetical protein
MDEPNFTRKHKLARVKRVIVDVGAVATTDKETSPPLY